MACFIIIFALVGFIAFQNFSPFKAWVQTVIAKAKGNVPPPAPPPAPPA